MSDPIRKDLVIIELKDEIELSSFHLISHLIDIGIIWPIIYNIFHL